MKRCYCRAGNGRRKMLYRDKLAAMMALASIQKTDRPTAKEVRCYECPVGRGWHLTSQPER
jgi:hypothetical protein